MTSIPRALIEVANTTSQMTPSPIDRSWIIEGNPIAELSFLSRSTDGQAWTVVWQCSEGKFHWYYDIDETILILEGTIVIESDGMPPAHYGPGDVIFFKEGAHAKWHVEGHVKKIAFCRKTNPAVIGFMIRVVNKLKRMFLSPGERRPATLMGAG